MVTNALVKQWEFIIAECDNIFCGRVGLMEVHYHNGEPAAYLCIGECLDNDWFDGPEEDTVWTF